MAGKGHKPRVPERRGSRGLSVPACARGSRGQSSLSSAAGADTRCPHGAGHQGNGREILQALDLQVLAEKPGTGPRRHQSTQPCLSAAVSFSACRAFPLLFDAVVKQRRVRILNYEHVPYCSSQSLAGQDLNSNVKACYKKTCCIACDFPDGSAVKNPPGDAG